MDSESDIHKLKSEEEIREILKVISRKGVGEILKSLRNSPKKFSQIMFETRLNPSIIDRHLKALSKLGLVTKEGENYKLTSCGVYVLKIFDDLYKAINP
ncbi:MAG: transcriptional regulator [Archaeoglobaceae archaeon]